FSDHVGGLGDLSLRFPAAQVHNQFLDPGEVKSGKLPLGDRRVAIKQKMLPVIQTKLVVERVGVVKGDALEDARGLAAAGQRGGILGHPHPAKRDVGQDVDAAVAAAAVGSAI